MHAATTETRSEPFFGLTDEDQELVFRNSNDRDALPFSFSRQELCGLIGGKEQGLWPLLLVF